MKKLALITLLAAWLLQPVAAETMLFWDDGAPEENLGYSYTWGVLFDEFKTGGDDSGVITRLGAVVYPNWPDSIYQGGYINVYQDDATSPGTLLGTYFLPISNPGYYDWIDIDDLALNTDRFWLIWTYTGSPPLLDALMRDDNGGNAHTYYFTDTQQYKYLNADACLRCYWDASPQRLDPASWGEVKDLYD